MKNLFGEAHRRSLWQVLGIYLAASWVALQVVGEIADSLALPDWVQPLAIILMVIGFPIVLATAFIQKGIRGGPSAAAPGTLATCRAAASITRSPALSQITASSASVHSGAEYSGCAWST